MKNMMPLHLLPENIITVYMEINLNQLNKLHPKKLLKKIKNLKIYQTDL